MSKIMINAIVFYQRYLSRFFAGACIYTPSCSQYAIEAIQKYGAIKGSQLAIARLLRCRPTFEGGYDPVK